MIYKTFKIQIEGTLATWSGYCTLAKQTELLEMGWIEVADETPTAD
jgi:hypothetical protein